MSIPLNINNSSGGIVNIYTNSNFVKSIDKDNVKTKNINSISSGYKRISIAALDKYSSPIDIDILLSKWGEKYRISFLVLNKLIGQSIQHDNFVYSDKEEAIDSFIKIILTINNLKGEAEKNFLHSAILSHRIREVMKKFSKNIITSESEDILKRYISQTNQNPVPLGLLTYDPAHFPTHGGIVRQASKDDYFIKTANSIEDNINKNQDLKNSIVKLCSFMFYDHEEDKDIVSLKKKCLAHIRPLLSNFKNKNEQWFNGWIQVNPERIKMAMDLMYAVALKQFADVKQPDKIDVGIYDLFIFDADQTLWDSSVPASDTVPPYDFKDEYTLLDSQGNMIVLNPKVKILLKTLKDMGKDLGLISKSEKEGVPFENQPVLHLLKKFSILYYFNELIVIDKNMPKSAFIPKEMNQRHILFIDDKNENLIDVAENTDADVMNINDIEKQPNTDNFNKISQTFNWLDIGHDETQENNAIWAFVNGRFIKESLGGDITAHNDLTYKYNVNLDNSWYGRFDAEKNIVSVTPPYRMEAREPKIPGIILSNLYSSWPDATIVCFHCREAKLKESFYKRAYSIIESKKKKKYKKKHKGYGGGWYYWHSHSDDNIDDGDSDGDGGNGGDSGGNGGGAASLKSWYKESSFSAMGEEAELINSEIIDGVKYELYKTSNDRGIIRIFDEDSEDVVNLTKYLDFDFANKKFLSTIEKLSYTNSWYKMALKKKEIDGKEYVECPRDCGTKDCYGLSGSMGVHFEVKKKDNKLWILPDRVKELKETCKEIKKDLKEWDKKSKLDSWYKFSKTKAGMQERKVHGNNQDKVSSFCLKDKILSIKSEMVLAAQRVYDSWEQDEEGIDEELGCGGICQDIADEMCSVLSGKEIDCLIVDNNGVGDQHVWIVAYDDKEAFEIDIDPSVYESGSGYSWTKKQGIKFSLNDISIVRFDRNNIDEILKYGLSIEINKTASNEYKEYSWLTKSDAFGNTWNIKFHPTILDENNPDNIRILLRLYSDSNSPEDWVKEKDKNIFAAWKKYRPFGWDKDPAILYYIQEQLLENINASKKTWHKIALSEDYVPQDKRPPKPKGEGWELDHKRARWKTKKKDQDKKSNLQWIKKKDHKKKTIEEKSFAEGGHKRQRKLKSKGDFSKYQSDTAKEKMKQEKDKFGDKGFSELQRKRINQRWHKSDSNDWYRSASSLIDTRDPWQMTQEEFKNPPELPQPKENYLIVYHKLSDPSHLESVLNEGLSIDKKRPGFEGPEVIWGTSQPTNYSKYGTVVGFEIPIFDVDNVAGDQFIIGRSIKPEEIVFVDKYSVLGAGYGGNRVSDQRKSPYAAEIHREYIKYAIDEDENIPEKVLIDYPELKNKIPEENNKESIIKSDSNFWYKTSGLNKVKEKIRLDVDNFLGDDPVYLNGIIFNIKKHLKHDLSKFNDFYTNEWPKILVWMQNFLNQEKCTQHVFLPEDIKLGLPSPRTYEYREGEQTHLLVEKGEFLDEESLELLVRAGYARDYFKTYFCDDPEFESEGNSIKESEAKFENEMRNEAYKKIVNFLNQKNVVSAQ